ncbi:MAG: pilus assembly PilX N-terminal domain-containing protein [Deltaproteobacteria bacterium]|nr:pilus assembly PilX N-terminal domain-containing protein [Deltaproteobacteria bacterium]
MNIYTISRGIMGQQGIVLVSALLVMAILIVLGTTAVMQTSTDIKISRNYKSSTQALYNAEAGIHYAIATLEQAMAHATFDIPSTNQEFNTFMAATGVPAGFAFEITGIDMTGPGIYYMRSIGTGPENASVTVAVHFIRETGPAIPFAAFGNNKFDGKSRGHVYSYDHRRGPQPGDADFVSTGEGDIGSNGKVKIEDGTYIDGDVILGTDGDNPDERADFRTPERKYTVTGVEGIESGWINPDPLGVLNQCYNDSFDHVQFNNDNGSLPGILNVEGITATITAGTYYFNEIIIDKKEGANGKLVIDASEGPVNIYVEGSVTLNQGQMLEIMNAHNEVHMYLKEPDCCFTGLDIFNARDSSVIKISGDPANFSLFSNSAAGIRFHNTGTLKGLIYAPRADEIELNSSSNFCGSVWGSTVLMHNGGDLFYDTALKDKYIVPLNDLSIVAWREEVRN